MDLIRGPCDCQDKRRLHRTIYIQRSITIRECSRDPYTVLISLKSGYAGCRYPRETHLPSPRFYVKKSSFGDTRDKSERNNFMMSRQVFFCWDWFINRRLNHGIRIIWGTKGFSKFVPQISRMYLYHIMYISIYLKYNVKNRSFIRQKR